MVSDDAQRHDHSVIKVHCDTEGKLAKDWNATLGDSDYVGQGILDAHWQPGYGRMSVLDASKVRWAESR